MKEIRAGSENFNSTSNAYRDLDPVLDIVKDATILFDGKQFMIKIPKEISEFYRLKKGQKFRLKVSPFNVAEGQNSFEIIKNK